MKRKRFFNNSYIEVTEYKLQSEKVVDKIVIAHLSDLHEKVFGEENANLLQEVEKLTPDIIVITGDIIAHEVQKDANLGYTKMVAQGLEKIAPTFFVTGNHEKNFSEQICETFEENGVEVLRNRLKTLVVKGATINILGVDDISFGSFNINEMTELFSDVSGFNVILTHRPELFDSCIDKGIDLVLAGHTHAGQIRIPLIGAPYMPGQGWFPKYVQGEITKKGTTMIISRGLGSSGYPTFRLNNPPDLVAITIEKR